LVSNTRFYGFFSFDYKGSKRYPNTSTHPNPFVLSY
jgi:hypothetical protein